MRVGYARVSTQQQSLDLQRDALAQAGCERIFEDVISGAKAERPGLDDALAFLREGDVLVVWKLDRLGRSLIHTIRLVNELKDRQVAVCSLQDGIDTSNDSPMANFVLSVFAALAELERDIIRERTLAGLEAARARGRRGGRPPKLNEQQIKLARTMHQDPAFSIEEICEQLGVSRRTLYKYLQRDQHREKTACGSGSSEED